MKRWIYLVVSFILIIGGLLGLWLKERSARVDAEQSQRQEQQAEEAVRTIEDSIQALCDAGYNSACHQLETIPDIDDDEVQDGEVQEPEVQEPEIQNDEPDDPDFNDPEQQNPEHQNPEDQDAEEQDAEVQESEEQEDEVQDPEIQDPENQDPEIDDPDPASPYEFVFTFTVPGEFPEEDRTYTVTCNSGTGNCTTQQN